MKQVVNIRGVRNKVIINRKNCKNSIFDKKTVKCLLKSEEDIKAGRTRKAKEVIKELKEKYGL